MEIGAVSVPSAADGNEAGGNVNPAPAPATGGSPLQWPENVTLEMLDVNLTEYKDAETVRSRFFSERHL